MIRVRHSLAFAIIATLIVTPGASSARQADLPPANTPHGALARLAELQPGLRHHLAGFLGTFDFVRAAAGRILVADDTRARAEDRAFAFLGTYGALVGMSDAERAKPRATFDVRSAEIDPTTGLTHVRLDQRYRGLEVFGADIAVHMNQRGITGISGTFSPGTSIRTTPGISKARAIGTAIKTAEIAGLKAHRSELVVYRDALITKQPGPSHLAWFVELTGPAFEEQVFVDATNRKVLNRIELIHHARDRCVYTPDYDPANPDLFIARAEGDPDTLIPPIDNLYRFTGQVYDIFDKAFDRDSYDAAGAKMRTVYESGARATSQGQLAACPNAYWRGAGKATHYCPGFDIDDVVAHEWAHAYTQFTHGLIYQNQPGALNEAYSDIWGEVIDLINGEDGIVGGDNNAEPYPNGVRWVIGEDLSEPVGDALALRDMWDPERRGLPAKVSSPSYVCTADGGGVHYNSSVPNHAFAMLVDGKTFNGHTVGAIGMDKTAHIYWQAQLNYQTRTTGFAEHAEALAASCADLIGVDPNGLTTGMPIGTPITASDCAQVDEAMLAVEMVDPPVTCGGPLLKSGAPGVCPGSTTLLTEDWEDGLAGWTLESVGNVPAERPGYSWSAPATLPDGRAGTAAYAYNNGDQNACKANSASNHAGKFSVTSAPIAVPGGTEQIQVRFDHYVATAGTGDGGNVMIKVNDGPFVPLATTDYLFNAPAGTIADGAGANEVDDPKKGQAAFMGADANVLTGSWGTSVARIGSAYVEPGDTFELRFEFGQDCVTGATGWYVDDVLVTVCPVPVAPALALGADYGAPDPDGSYTLEWTRPAGATGPEDIEEALIGLPLFADDAESGLGKWVTEVGGEGIYVVGTEPARGWDTGQYKPSHDSSTFWAFGHELSANASASMTTAAPVSVPATGEAVLSFESWHSNDDGDRAIVEISPDAGATWNIVFRENTPTGLTGGVVATPVTQYAEFLTEPMENRSVNLAAYAGEDILVRFRFTQGGTIFVNVARLGWFVDNIAIDHVGWQPLVTSSESSYLVTGRAAGTYLYRARTTYPFGLSDWSGAVTAVVS